MENDNIDAAPPVGAAPASSRWNPTKEQINMLEGLYRQGIRTPSAEQIQQITARLRAHGHIEGKNVFYWFQNHKARQRQKQKQENMALANRFLHNKKHSPPLLLPAHPSAPCTNVVCSPYYYMQHNGVGFYHPSPQCPKVLLPGGVRKRPTMDKVESYNNMISLGEGGDGNEGNMRDRNNSSCGNETLALFPQHPTGILEMGGTSVAEESNPWCSSKATTTIVAEEGCGAQPFFNFFGEKTSCEDE